MKNPILTILIILFGAFVVTPSQAGAEQNQLTFKQACDDRIAAIKNDDIIALNELGSSWTSEFKEHFFLPSSFLPFGTTLPNPPRCEICENILF